MRHIHITTTTIIIKGTLDTRGHLQLGFQRHSLCIAAQNKLDT